MIVYTLLAATLLIALLSLWLLLRSRSVVGLLLPVAMAVFIYLYGAWVFLSVYGRYVFAGAFVLALAISLLKRKWLPSGKRAVPSILLAALFTIIDVLYFTGTTGKPYGTINLQMPFKHGKYFVFQGGRGLPTNVFHSTGRKTLFAMDIIKLNKSGGRGNNIFSKTLTDYEIFGDTIYSPCAGVISKMMDDNPDNIPPTRRRGPTNLNGVLLETDSAYIFMGHMQYKKVFVHEGDSVAVGQSLGLAGNSGMSIEPHLHIQAHAKTFTGLPFYKEPQLLILFKGKEYRLFEDMEVVKE